MKIKGFKTFTENLEYLNWNFLPVIRIECFELHTTILFIGWLIWGFQIIWNTVEENSIEEIISKTQSNKMR